MLSQVVQHHLLDQHLDVHSHVDITCFAASASSTSAGKASLPSVIKDSVVEASSDAKEAVVDYFNNLSTDVDKYKRSLKRALLPKLSASGVGGDGSGEDGGEAEGEGADVGGNAKHKEDHEKLHEQADKTDEKVGKLEEKESRTEQ